MGKEQKRWAEDASSAALSQQGEADVSAPFQRWSMRRLISDSGQRLKQSKAALLSGQRQIQRAQEYMRKAKAGDEI